MIGIIQDYKQTKPPYQWTYRGWGLKRNHWARENEVAHYILNENGGNKVYDVSGNNWTGTFSGSTLPTWETDRRGRCLSFVTDNADHVSISDSTVFTPSRLSVSYWVRAVGTLLQFDGHLGRTNANNWTQGWGFFWNSSTSIHFFCGQYNVNPATSSGITSGNWNHVVGTWDGTTIRLYINGVKQTDGSFGGSIAVSSYFELGRVGTNARSLNGRLDNVRVYDRVLNQSEISSLYRDEYPEWNDRIWVGVAAAPPGGATIPIFHHHYQLARSA